MADLSSVLLGRVNGRRHLGKQWLTWLAGLRWNFDCLRLGTGVEQENREKDDQVPDNFYRYLWMCHK
jgi:hypothetical protein